MACIEPIEERSSSTAYMKKASGTRREADANIGHKLVSNCDGRFTSLVMFLIDYLEYMFFQVFL